MTRLHRKRKTGLIVALAACLLSTASYAHFQGGQETAAEEKPTTEADVPSQVALLLAERCGDCHSPDSEKNKAKRNWADAFDLLATASNDKLVVPGDPGNSDLFLSVDFDDMPPEEDEGGPLSDAEKQLISDWIAAGAVVPPPPNPSENSESTAAEPEVALQPEIDSKPTEESVEAPVKTEKPSHWMKAPIFDWLGRFHPIVVHFPIALISVAVLAELLARLRRQQSYQSTADFCLAIGALSAIPAAFLGWLLAENTSHRGSDLDWHRWLGTSAPILALLTIFLVRKNPKLRLPLFGLLAGLVGITGHLGGGLTFGSDWLDWPG